MKVIKPLAVDAGVLVSTNAAESVALYSAATQYALGAQVRRTETQRVYECIQGPSTGNTPESSPLYWVDKGPTNSWAMFDSQISTATRRAQSLTVELAPGYINALALVGVVGAQVAVTALDAPGGSVVYSRTINLDAAVVTDWYEYLTEPIDLRGDVVLTDLPSHLAMRITITVTATGADVALGHCMVGLAYELGDVEYGAQAGISDYSRKDTDANGVTTFVRRAYSKRVSVRLMLSNRALNKVQTLLGDLRATPCMWIGSDNPYFTPLLVFGFYKDFSLDIAYPTESLCTLEIEGLT